MSIILGGLAARAFWSRPAGLEPVPSSQIDDVVAQSRCTAASAKLVRTTDVFREADPSLRCAQACRDPRVRPEMGTDGHAANCHLLPPVVLDLVVDEDAKSHRIRNTRGSRLSGSLPPGSLLAVRDVPDLYVVSPAQQVVLDAKRLDKIDSLLQACEYCSTYRLRPDLSRGFETVDRPWCTAEELAEQVTQNGGRRGIKGARFAAAHAVEMSASPMETALALLLALPIKTGGYGLPAPELNQEIETTGHLRTLVGPGTALKPDLYWPDAKLDLEYDSDGFHGSPEAAAADRTRRTALQAAGINPVSVTLAMLRGRETTDGVARIAAEALGTSFELPAITIQMGLRARLLSAHPVW